MLLSSLSPLVAAGVVLASYAPVSQLMVDFPAPEIELRALPTDEFTTFTHAAYPAHNVRIKRTADFCNNSATSYSGYIDIEARHLFFYFHESRSDPDKDPVVMWINGGPGCTSAIGAFMELGPCNIHNSDGPKYNPHAWNSNANLFILDQPVGVGFSYADYGETITTTEEAAADVAAFVAVFFETFSKFKGRPFHMSGESYGGRYLPVFASAVYESNAQAVAEGRTPVNLQSVIIGNGITNFAMMSWSYYDIACTNAGIDPVPLPISTCIRMKTALPRCKQWHTENCLDKFDGLACGAANNFCVAELTLPYVLSGKNPYNVAGECSSVEDLCYPLTRDIRAFLDRDDVRRELGVSEKIGNFTSCADDVITAFRGNLDNVKISDPYVAELLQRGVPVLIYVGTYDWICNWVGNLAWTSALEWPGHDEFNAQELREWAVDGVRAGQVKRAGPLTYATVEAAGHMVPYDKPVQALAMLNRWLAGKEL